MQPRYSNDDQHAVFSIVRYLSELKLDTWCSVILLWLAQYDGLEQFLDPCDAPTTAVRNLLAKYIEDRTRIFPKVLVSDLSSLPFLSYRASLSHDNAMEWEPLQVSFIEFCQWGEVHVWQSESPCPDKHTTQSYLHSSYQRQQTVNQLLYGPFLTRS